MSGRYVPAESMSYASITQCLQNQVKLGRRGNGSSVIKIGGVIEIVEEIVPKIV